MPDLKADYSAPNHEDKSFSQNLPNCSREPATEEKTSYLTSLRLSITDMQDSINVFLTKNMEEDNQKAGTAAANNDAKEEENYGEEAVDED